ncbi:GNAT family N-acetyltransferase [Bacillus sp. AFS015802]|uniref:GNAT family N-acetyltransferase n=1 Tax=Bacillus sp. AFS015802 TaxID=2033486 RepID=UPI000BF94A57|nr:GNAT family N-acetyltransferase [Bacillus sp. AFS015802]PFA67180.1 GNAT family N-acetyltransferase [Bacillus sp. AFS015802]
MKNINIGRPHPDDKKELNHFFRAVIEDTFANEGLSELHDDIKNEISTKIQYLQSDYDSAGTDRYFLIAKMGQTIVGTIEYGEASELIKMTTGGDLTDIHEVGTIYVHPCHQGRGIGSLLLNTMILTLLNRGIEEFCLDSGFTNAQKVWTKKLGNPDYWLKDYWGKGSDHMIWKRNVREFPIIFSV